MQKYKKFVSDVSLIGMANVLNNLKSFLVIPLLTKSLGAFNYGIWTQMKITVLLLVPFLTLGAEQAIVKFLSGETDTKKIREEFFSCLFSTFAISSLIALIFVVFAPTVSSWIFNSAEFAGLVRVLAVLVIFESLNLLLLEYFKAFRYIKTYFKTLLAETILEFGLIALAIVYGYGIVGAVVGLLIARIIFVIVRIIQVSRHIGIILPIFSKIKKYARFGMPLVISSFLFFLLNWSNRYFLNYFSGLSEVGRYSVAYLLAYSVTFVASPIGYILFPTVSSCVAQSKPDEAQVYLKYSLKYFIVAGVPLICAILFYAKELLVLFSTTDFLNAYVYLPLLILGLFIFQIGVIGEYVTIIFNKNMVVLKVYLVLAILNTVLNIVFIPIWGAAGAALAIFISFLAYTIFNLSYCQRFISFGIDTGTLIKICLAAILMLATFYVCTSIVALKRQIYLAPIGGMVYIAALYTFNCFTKKEILLFKTMLGKKGNFS